MKTLWKVLLLVCFVSFLLLFKPRQDIILAAVNKSQYIKLFEQGNEFMICIDDNNLFTGTYAFSTDTVYLFYLEHLEYSTMNLNTSQPKHSNQLPKKLFINTDNSHIRSADGSSFSAVIYKDLRHKIDRSTFIIDPDLKGKKAQVVTSGPYN